MGTSAHSFPENTEIEELEVISEPVKSPLVDWINMPSYLFKVIDVGDVIAAVLEYSIDINVLSALATIPINDASA